MSGLVGVGGILVGLIVGFGLERLAESRRLKFERNKYLQERRDEAYRAWLSAVPQYATALNEWRRLVEAGVEGEDEAANFKRKADDLDINQVRPALNTVRLYGTPVVINRTRRAFKLLVKANRRSERGLPPAGEIGLDDYRAAFETCLRDMRGDVGSAVAGERLDPAGQADLKVIDTEIDREIAVAPTLLS